MSLEPGCVAADNRAESKASLLHSDPYLIALVQASDVGRLDAITLQFLIDGPLSNRKRQSQRAPIFGKQNLPKMAHLETHIARPDFT
jgi:hypothetical protein